MADPASLAQRAGELAGGAGDLARKLDEEMAALLDEETADDLARLAERGHAISLVFLGEKLPERLDRRISARLLPEVRLESSDGSVDVVALRDGVTADA